jgi:hypothetical protein
MTEASPASGARRHRLKAILLGSPALSVMLLAGNAAMAAPPTAGSLPGAFTTNIPGTTYTGTGSTATITITGATVDSPAGQVLQFGGASAGTTVSPTVTTVGGALATATNPGFSVGAGAALTIAGSGVVRPTLINDQSGSPSQIYGSVNASGLNGALYVANSNGVVVGAGGSLTSPGLGTGLLGYSVDSSAFGANGTITVNSAINGTGGVTVDPAATLVAGELLVASNGAVSVGAAPVGGVEVIAGYGFTTAPGDLPVGGVVPSSLLPSSAATVAFSGGSTLTPLDVVGLGAAGSVTNSGIITLPPTGFLDVIVGSFTNTGIATVANSAGLTAGSITNSGTLYDSTGALTTVAANGAATGADITNTGIINDAAATLMAHAGVTGATGNFNNTGKINFTTAAATGVDSVSVTAANIQLAGSIAARLIPSTTPTALSATNALASLTLTTSYGPTPLSGDIDYATTAYTNAATLTGGAVRILAGGLFNPAIADGSTIGIAVGSGTVADPFTGTTLGNNLSLFPNTTVQAATLTVAGTATTPTQVGSNINLDGVLSTQVTGLGNSIMFTNVNNITGAGGLAFKDGGSFIVNGYTGNINNPNGAAVAGSTAFQYNYLPIAVANSTSGTAGTVNISLTGQSASSGTAQFVNVLAKGNAVLVNTGTPPLTPPASTTGITPASTYTNNHLVVQATGNIGFNPGIPPASTTTFYWPGLVYLNTVASATTPTTQSTGGSITLGTLVTPTAPTSTPIALNNVLPAAVTGNGGIFLVTNNLNLDGSTVTTNANSWVNFVSTQVASAFATTSPSSFFNAYVTAVTPSVSQLSIQALPTGSFQ